MTDTPATEPLAGFDGFLDDDDLVLPAIASTKYPKAVGGKVYTVPQPSAKDGARFAALGQIMARMAAKQDVTERDVKRLQMDDAEEMDFLRDALGPTYDEMVEDGVNFQRIKVAGNYAFVSFAFSQSQADQMAEAGVLTGKAVPSAAPANREGRRAAAKGKSKSKAKSSR